MKRLIKALAGPGRLAIATLALSGIAVLLLPGTTAAQGCRGGPLSTSPGNIIGSAVGGATGGLIGNQFGRGSGKDVMTGVGVVGGALAGGYVGRSMEGCGNAATRAAAPARHHAPSRAATATATDARSCRFVVTQGVIDGREQQVDGIACRAADGNWRIASDAAAERAAEADLVLRAQQRLHEQGFYVRDNIDGRWGPATSSALRNFQRVSGLTPTGQLDVATQKSLSLAPSPLAAMPAVAEGEGLPPDAARQAPAPAPATAAGSSSPPAEAR
jgi:surface antigen